MSRPTDRRRPKIASTYPVTLDVFAPTPSTLAGPMAHSLLHKQATDAIAAIEAELGVDPSGPSATVAAALAARAPLVGWIPQLTADFIVAQSSNALTKTVNYAAYHKVGTRVRWQGLATLSGTFPGPGLIQVNFPTVAPVAAGAWGGVRPIGTGLIFDSSVNNYFRALAIPTSATVLQLMATNSISGNYLGSADFTAALAAGDTVSWDVEYETIP